MKLLNELALKGYYLDLSNLYRLCFRLCRSRRCWMMAP